MAEGSEEDDKGSEQEETREKIVDEEGRGGHTDSSSADFHTTAHLSDDISGVDRLKSRFGDGCGCGRIACSGLKLWAFFGCGWGWVEGDGYLLEHGQ